jgi:hypothetical protein
VKLKFDSERAETIYFARRNVLWTDDGCEIFEGPGLETPMMNTAYLNLRMAIWRKKQAARKGRNPEPPVAA